MAKDRKNPMRSVVGMLLVGAGLAGLGTTYFQEVPVMKMVLLGAGILVLGYGLIRVLRYKEPDKNS